MEVINTIDAMASRSLPMDVLRTFIAAVESGSFTKASECVHRSQAAVSMQMRRLEDELGVVLFDRSGRGVSLTFAGETLLTYARRILALQTEAVSAMTMPEMEGRIRFGAPEDYATCFLPGILAAFHAAYPRVQVEMYCAASEWLNDRFDKGELDIALLTHAYEPDTNAATEVVHREPIVWVGRKNGNAHEKRPLPLAVFHEGCPYRQWAMEACEQAEIDYRISFVSPSLTGVVSAVRAGIAVAPIGKATVDESLSVLGKEAGLPELPSAFVCLHKQPDQQHESVEALAQYVRRAWL